MMMAGEYERFESMAWAHVPVPFDSVSTDDIDPILLQYGIYARVGALGLGDPCWPVQELAYSELPMSFGRTILGQYGLEFGQSLAAMGENMTVRQLEHVLPSVVNLITKDKIIGDLFPADLSDKAAEAYQENVASLIFSLGALQQGQQLPTRLPLKNGGEIPIGSYTFGQAIDISKQLNKTLNTMAAVTADTDAVITRVNQTGTYGMYRHTSIRGSVLETIRLIPSTAYDKALEYGTCRSGTQPTIGLSIDIEQPSYMRAYKDEQTSPFSLRIDNEGDTLALDIGSILSDDNSFGKQVAGLIALGDWLRSQQTGSDTRLNHNSRPFKGSGLEKTTVFAQIAGKRAAEIEGRRTTAQQLRQFVRAQTVAA
jgi:hypothetical protein